MKNNTKKIDAVDKVIMAGLFIVALVILINTVTMFSLSGAKLTNTVVLSSSEIIPSGTPKFYGQELEVSYDDVSPSNPQLADLTIEKLAEYDKTITLEGELLQRYITIGSSISCEYCCGAQAIIFSNGQAACGCAHSYAMRGLAKYLLTEHPEMTDMQILEELGKWKVLFFPEIHEQKVAALKEQGIEVNYINLASNKYRGIEQGITGGSMVGGC